jgi:hypothetical protein
MTTQERYVPKVHPLARDAEAEDPMELFGSTVQGDPDVMLQCLIEEFASLGWDAESLMALFYSPQYPVLNQLRVCLGEPYVRQQVRELLAQRAAFRISATIDEEVEPEEEDEPELIQLGIRSVGSRRL